MVPAAPEFGFDEVAEIDAVTAPVIIEAGLTSAIALVTPRSIAGSDAPMADLDLLMNEFSGGGVVGRDARYAKYIMVCYIDAAQTYSSEAMYQHFKGTPSLTGYVSVMRRGTTTAVMVVRSSSATVLAARLNICVLAPRFDGRLPPTSGSRRPLLKQILDHWCA